MSDIDWEQFEDEQFLNTDENIGIIQNQVSQTPVPKPLKKSAQKINLTHFTFLEKLKDQQSSHSQQCQQPPLSQSSATLHQNNNNSPLIPISYRNKDVMSTMSRQNHPNFTSKPHVMTEPNISFPSPQPAQQTSNIIFQNLPPPTQFCQDGQALSGGALSGRSYNIEKNFNENAQGPKTTFKVLSSLSHEALSEQEILSQLLKQPSKIGNKKLSTSKQNLAQDHSSSVVPLAQTSSHSKDMMNIGVKSMSNFHNKQSLATNAQQQLQEEMMLHVPDENDEGVMMCQQEYTQAVINALIGDSKGNIGKTKKAQKELVKNQLE